MPHEPVAPAHAPHHHGTGAAIAGRLSGVIELRAGSAVCTISPDDGGRVGSLRIGQQQILVERSDVAEATEGGPDPMSWGSFPMAPWAGRVRHGRFVFRGTRYELPINLAPHSIHGTVFTRAWHVDLVEDNTSATLSCDLGLHWPFGGLAMQTISLGPDRLDCMLAVTSAANAMPVTIGWHPWFVEPRNAELYFARMYRRDSEGIPTGVLVPPPPGPWDDCFVEPAVPITVRYETCTLTVTSDCDHWVVYDQPRHATCIEPQSGPPDAFNLKPDVLEPGKTLQRTMTIRW